MVDLLSNLRPSYVALLAIPVVAGASIAVAVARGGSSAVALIAVLSLGLVVAAWGPRLLLTLIVSLAVIGFVPTLLSLGPVQLRLDDLLFLPLVLWIVLIPTNKRWAQLPDHVRGPLQRGLLFITYVGLSVCAVAVVDPDHLSVSLVSFLRLLQTLSLVWISFHVVTDDRDAAFLIGWMTIAAAIAVAIAASQGVAGGAVLTDRFGGFLNANTLGLVSGFLVVAGLFSRTIAPRPLSFLSLGVGAAGLLLSKSIGGIAATSVVVGVGFVWRRQVDRRLVAGVATPVLFGVIGVVIVGAVSLLRPESLPLSEDFRGSSVYHRLIIGATGLQTFAEHPLIGVGWQRGSSEVVIQNEDIALAIRQKYPDVKPYLYPEVEPTNFHNAFIQILAELGMIGFILFWYAVWGVGGAVRRIQARSPRFRSDFTFLVLSLLLILIWWNDNAIFGGQTESVVGAVFLGALLGLAQEGRLREQRAVA